MGEISIRTENILRCYKCELRREGLMVRVTAYGILVCAGMLLSSFYGNKMLLLPSAFGIAVLLYFYLSERLFLSGRMFCLSGESETAPAVRFFTVMRFALFKVAEGIVKLLWLNFFLLPSRIMAVIVIRTLYETGNIQRAMLFTLITAFMLLSTVGICFYFYLSGRYFLAELLFLRCPGQSPFEILKNSALLTSAGLTRIMLFRIRNALCTGKVKRKMRCALYAGDLFSDRKFYKNYGLVRPLTSREPS